MARTASLQNHKFSNKLILNQWLMSQFGIDPLLEYKDNTKPFHKLAAPLKETRLEGYDTDGLHTFYHALVDSELFYNDFHAISKEELLVYEENIVRHTLKINKYRGNPIVWKYFQWLSLVFVEIYLDRYFTDKEMLMEDLNSYVQKFNAKWKGFHDVELYTIDDLNKLCLQNATGSGKTLLMHMNLLQFKHYSTGHDIDNIILITPNERMTQQHVQELNESGFHFVERLGSDSVSSMERLYVVEITKFGDKAGPQTITTSSRGDKNLLFVDEGHKGLNATAEGAFFRRRQELSNNGFVFEYSATFEQAVKKTNNKALESSYSKSILFNYSYRWFHEDGYGKEFKILNLPESYEGMQEVYLCACVLRYYQQLLLYEDKYKEYCSFNIEKPLLVFVGSTVSKAIGGGKDDSDVIADVAKVIHFLVSFVSRPSMFQDYILKILFGTGSSSGLIDERSRDIFEGSFRYLTSIFENRFSVIEKLYQDILGRVFHNSSGGVLHLSKIKGDSGELHLYLGNTDTPFGLINVGDAKGLGVHLVKTMEQQKYEMVYSEDEFSVPVFEAVKDSNSSLNILVGSKKFIEGWDCWRVSTMGLMHFGVGEGSQIIQLFGRGVRLKGYQWSLKRSSRTVGIHRPEYLDEVETLNIFGVEANFMTFFRKMLEEEGLPSNELVEPIKIKINVTYDFDKKLKILKAKKNKSSGREYDFKKDGPIPYLSEVSDYIRKNPIVADWYPQIKMMVGTGVVGVITKNTVILSKQHLSLLDYDRLYLELERYKRERAFYNLNIDKSGIMNLVSDSSWYRLYIPANKIALNSFEAIETIQKVATKLLKDYCKKYYDFCKDRFYKPRMELIELNRDDQLMPQDNYYTIAVDSDQIELINGIRILKKEIEQNKPHLLPVGDLQVCRFSSHLYEPLLSVSPNSRITIRPVTLNESEYQFVTDLKTWCDKNQKDMKDKGQELYLLRNLSRGKGVGFFEAGNFHPDFILWVLSEGKQYVHFIEPHGLMHEGVNSEKIQFHKRIKEIETRLADPNVILSSWILSWTPKQELKLRGYDPDEYLKNNVVFMEDHDYINNVVCLTV